jgi:hypothetical protein
MVETNAPGGCFPVRNNFAILFLIILILLLFPSFFGGFGY